MRSFFTTPQSLSIGPWPRALRCGSPPGLEQPLALAEYELIYLDRFLERLKPDAACIRLSCDARLRRWQAR
jgi:hypothetical protein